MRRIDNSYLVKPGTKISLNKFDPAGRGKHESQKKSEVELIGQLEKMGELQYKMYAENRHSLLIVLQGMDTSGKDGVIRHVLTGMNPLGCSVTRFNAPTPEELAHDFLWRVHLHAPRKGAVSIFNRSHYEDVLIVRVHKLVPEKEWRKRHDFINEFERLLTQQNKTTVLKFFLHISKEEQLARFKKRLENKSRNWKISESDYTERELWDDYTEAYEDLLSKTSTEHSPWYIVPSDHKWYRNLVVSRIILDTLENFQMKLPSPNVDLKEIARKYHQEKKESDRVKSARKIK